MEGVEVKLHSFLTSALDGCGFTLGKEPRSSWNRRLGGPQSRSRLLWEEKYLAFTGIQTPDLAASSVVAIPATILCLPCRSFYFENKPQLIKPESSPPLSQKSKIVRYTMKQTVQFKSRPSHGSGCSSQICHFRGMSVIPGQSVSEF